MSTIYEYPMETHGCNVMLIYLMDIQWISDGYPMDLWWTSNGFCQEWEERAKKEPTFMYVMPLGPVASSVLLRGPGGSASSATESHQVPGEANAQRVWLSDALELEAAQSRKWSWFLMVFDNFGWSLMIFDDDVCWVFVDFLMISYDHLII